MNSPRQFPEVSTILNRVIEKISGDAILTRYLKASKRRLSCKGHSLSLTGIKHIFVLSIGKAAPSMAKGAIRVLKKGYDGTLAGLIVTKDHHGFPVEHCVNLEAPHPVPNLRSLRAVKRVRKKLRSLPAENCAVLILLSGGGSSLLCLPSDGLTLVEKQNTIDALLKSGAPIQTINCIRKHLSAIKGGRLAAAACPARVTTLAISDVVGDDPSIIASGPTVGNPSTRREALAAFAEFDVPLTDNLKTILEDPQCETPALDSNAFDRATWHLLASPGDAIEAASALARETHPGLTIHNLGAELEGEARDIGRAHADLVADLAENGGDHLILSGGELTVTFSEAARGQSTSGGPNHEYLLAMLLALPADAPVYALAGDTDGKDGSASAAGAWIDPQSAARAISLSINADQALNDHQSGQFFADLGQNLVTGPTHTNVNDFRAILILEP